MPFNGTGIYLPPPADFPAVPLTVISSTKFNSLINDISVALSNCMTRDGQSPATMDIPLGGNQITGLDDGLTNDAAVNAHQLVNQGLPFVAATGTPDAIVLTVNPLPVSYASIVNAKFMFQCPGVGVNTSTIDLSIAGLGHLSAGAAAGYVVAGAAYIAVFQVTVAFIYRIG